MILGSYSGSSVKEKEPKTHEHLRKLYKAHGFTQAGQLNHHRPTKLRTSLKFHGNLHKSTGYVHMVLLFSISKLPCEAVYQPLLLQQFSKVRTTQT